MVNAEPAHPPPATGPSPAAARRRRPPVARPTDEELIEAACSVFGEAGYHETTMDAVAARAGTSKPTLYAHFGSKEDLYRLCADRAAETLAAELVESQRAATGQPLEEQVRAGMIAFFGFATDRPAMYRMLFGDDTAGYATAARERVMSAAAAETALRIRAYAESHRLPSWDAAAELCAWLIVGLAVEGARYALVTRSLDADTAGDFATDFAVAALRHLDPAIAARLDRTPPDAPERAAD
ncbi:MULTISPECIES: TetR/AcrR family transcriptional regulator [Streptomyces]|uniref:TetR/AcrR family transcriptional regulator n=1 Tax=Streptomyces lycii TaxID=2654337 RepID=A0ABQ7FPJ2_9ACTN|nr:MULTISPECIES: TetR/AcrR family transcriptional regulator [Streptomyces]KAF4409686.1 TetR/AcrR family transcriptional regulator [Streptomyces lycii]